MSLSSLLITGVFKSLFVPLSFLGIRSFFDEHYSDPQCGIRLVNESAPDHYRVHPVWKDITYDDSCKDEALQTYLSSNTSNRFESDLVIWSFGCFTVVGSLAIMYHLCKRCQVMPKLSDFLWLGCISFTSYHTAKLMFMHTHFQQDILYMTGAIIHHAQSKLLGLDKKEGSVTQGYLLCGLVNQAFYTYCLWSFTNCGSNNNRKSQKGGASERIKVFNSVLLMSFLQLWVLRIINVVKYEHPLMHEMESEIITDPYPFTFMYRAYHHVIVHHNNGESFGADFFFDPLYDKLMYLFGYLHNDLLKLELSTLPHYAFTATFDALIATINASIIWFHLFIFSKFFSDAKKADTFQNSDKNKLL